jgi:hypothetical protein
MLINYQRLIYKNRKLSYKIHNCLRKYLICNRNCWGLIYRYRKKHKKLCKKCIINFQIKEGYRNLYRFNFLKQNKQRVSILRLKRKI